MYMDYTLSVLQETASLFMQMSPFLLLGFLLAGILHEFVPGQLYARYLSADNMRSVLMAALLGIPLPLCSCGVIPTAMSLRREGASKGAVVSFLIATPQTGVDSIIATYSLMWLPFAVLRPIAALLTALWGGFLVNATRGREKVAAVSCACGLQKQGNAPAKPFVNRLGDALRYAYVEMMEDIGRWLAVGLLVAGLITALVPDSLFAVFHDNTLLSILFVLLFSIPMYMCATGSIPIAVALMAKGITPGAALVLLMAGPACNMASMLVIGKVLGRKTLVAYLTSIVTGAVVFAFGMDCFLPRTWFVRDLYAGVCCTAGHVSWWHVAGAVMLLALLLNALLLKRLGGDAPHHHHHDDNGGEVLTTGGHGRWILHVEGMNCNHCAANAQRALEGVSGVTAATVDLDLKTAVVEGTDVETERMLTALAELGFTATVETYN